MSYFISSKKIFIVVISLVSIPHILRQLVHHKEQHLSHHSQDYSKSVDINKTPNPSTQPSPFVCHKKQENVALLKVRRTGSTTAANILLRYGLENNLQYHAHNNVVNLFKPDNRTHVLSNRRSDEHNSSHLNPNSNKKNWSKDTFYVAFIREPIPHFMSLFFHSEIFKKAHQNAFTLKTNTNGNAFREFFGNLHTYSNESKALKNPLSVDLGLSISQMDNFVYVQRFIETVNKQFKLVLLQRHFVDSVVMLKRYLCWDLMDVLYIPLQTDTLSHSAQQIHKMSSIEIQHLRRWNHLDFQLYEFFRKRLSDQVKAEGSSFENEVFAFKILQQTVKDFCYETNKESKLYVAKSDFHSDFVLSKDVCKRMRMSESELLKRLNNKLHGR